MSDRIPDLLLERLRRGELAPVEAARLRARLGAEGEARLAALEVDDRRVLAEHAPDVVVAEVERRLRGDGMAWQGGGEGADRVGAQGRVDGSDRVGSPDRVVWHGGWPGWQDKWHGRWQGRWLASVRRWRGPILGLTLAGAAAVAAIVGLSGVSSPDLRPDPLGIEGDGVRAKGDARLLIYRPGAGAEPDLLAEGSPVRAGDVVQLGVLLDRPGHVAVVSVDGRGALTVHHPAGAATVLLPAGRQIFDHAFAFDDAPDYERFFLVTAPDVIDLDALRLAVEGLDDAREDALALPAEWRQTSILIVKEMR